MWVLLNSIIFIYIVINIVLSIAAIKFAITDDTFDDIPYLYIFDEIWFDLNVNLFSKVFLTILCAILCPGILLFAGTYKLFY